MTGVVQQKYSAITIGVSAGGLNAITHIFEYLPESFPLPMLVVQHRAYDERVYLEELLRIKCKIKLKQAEEKEPIKDGVVYFAPPDYHLLVESDLTLSLSFDPPVNYSRPSIDVMFESAAEVYRNKLVGIILTGANGDGAKGIKYINQYGGLTIAQSPASSQYPAMPLAAIQTGAVQYIMDLDQIKSFLLNF